MALMGSELCCKYGAFRTFAVMTSNVLRKLLSDSLRIILRKLLLDSLTNSLPEMCSVMLCCAVWQQAELSWHC